MHRGERRQNKTIIRNANDPVQQGISSDDVYLSYEPECVYAIANTTLGAPW